MCHRQIVMLVAGLLCLPVWGQAADWLEDFSEPELAARWTRDVSSKGALAVDAKHQVLILSGKENVYNHLETDLPADFSSVQLDVNNVSDPSASWAPSAILYWGPQSYLRVMVSHHYGLRLEWAPGKGIQALPESVRPVPDTWYRLRMQLKADIVTVSFGLPGEGTPESFEVKRLPEWQGPCRLIVGKGYMPPLGGSPDFDNDYGRGDRNVIVHLDNIVVGNPQDLEAQLAASVARARIAGEHDLQLLRVALWPNVLGERTRDTLWLAEGAFQRVCLVYENRDVSHSAKRVQLEVEVSEHLSPQELIAGKLPIQTQESRQDGLVHWMVDFPATFVLPADFHGVNKRGGDQPGWFSWPTSPLLPPVYLHCRPRSRQPGVLRARLWREGQPGAWTEAKAVVLPPLPPAAQADERHLGLSLWDEGTLVSAGPRGQALAEQMLRQYQAVGLRRLHIHSHASVFELARKLGIHANLSSWWHYSAQCPADVLPSPEEKSTEPTVWTPFCPEIIATGAGTYGRFLETVTARMKEYNADGYMLDYECAPPLCYCARCQEAFKRHTGVADANWPQDVKKGGRYYRQWIEFRCEQGARYVKVIGEAARRAKPGCPLQAWVAGYDYGGSIESAQIDISKAAAYLTEPEVPHYTLPDDYSDMWRKDAGLASVEEGIKTVQDSLNVTSKPVVFCSSVIYPLGAATPWSDPQLLNAQMLAMIGQGVRGISFWGGHDDGAVDGRFLHMLAKWNSVLAASGRFLWDGKREDGRVAVEGADGNLVRKYVWVLQGETLVFVVNLAQESKAVKVQGLQSGRELLSGRALDLSQPLTVPALDGVMVLAGA